MRLCVTPTDRLGCSAMIVALARFKQVSSSMKYFQKPGPELADRVPPGQHLAKGFPVLTYGETPDITPEAWTLELFGFGETQTFTWADLMALPQQHFTADFH